LFGGGGLLLLMQPARKQAVTIATGTNLIMTLSGCCMTGAFPKRHPPAISALRAALRGLSYTGRRRRMASSVRVFAWSLPMIRLTVFLIVP
jgi:hypothetical protein